MLDAAYQERKEKKRFDGEGPRPEEEEQEETLDTRVGTRGQERRRDR